MENDLKYVLEIEGKDYSINHHDGLRFKEHNFYMSIQEAVYGLMIRDIRQFDREFDDKKHAQLYDSARVISTDNQELIFEIQKLPYHGTLEAPRSYSILGGIYMNFGDKTVGDFERLTGFDFYFQQDYDPNAHLLLHALYIDDPKYGRGLYAEFNTGDWTYNLQMDEEDKRDYENQWKYKVEIIESAVSGPDSPQIRKYHFHTLPQASKFFLKTNIDRMDKVTEQDRNETHWISSALLQHRYDGKIAELIVGTGQEQMNTILRPGIYLKSFVPIEQLEKGASIDLSGLSKAAPDNQLLTLAIYRADSHLMSPIYNSVSRLTPNPEYIKLLLSIGVNQVTKKETDDTLLAQKRISSQRIVRPPDAGSPKL